MSKFRVNEQDNLLPEQVNPELWPSVDEQTLNTEARVEYLKRKQAVLMYFKREGDYKEIYSLTGIRDQNLRRLIKRCMSIDSYGVVWGFRALIPQKNVKDYKLNIINNKKNDARNTGEFKLLLEKYPDIKELIDDLFLGRNRRTLEPGMKPKYIHKKFIDACREKGIALTNYPFNTSYLGSKALQRYLRELSAKYFGKVSTRVGIEAAQRAKRVGIGEQNHPSTLTPYQKVQFDAHRIDGIFVIDMITPEGDIVTLTLDRFWILTLIDIATRTVIGYSISLNKEYNASDVMQCVRNSVIPHTRVSLTISGLTYHEVGGFPSEVFEEAKWAVWDVICYDNAKSHLSNLVQDRLKNLIGCISNLGPVALPTRRGIMERFFQTFEEIGVHRLPNTTGSNPNDPRRNDPEKNAVKWNISYEHLKQIIDVLISNYNGTPHGGIYHQSPLELLGKRLKTGLFPRILETENQSEILFLQTTITGTVRGSQQSGKRPYIQYKGVEYRSDKLSNSAHLIGKQLKLQVNVDDIRTLKAYLQDGSEFGYLSAAGKWSLTPHTLQNRIAINSLVKRKMIHFTTWDDPMFVYIDYLKKNAASKKRGAVNKVTHVTEVSQAKRKKVNEPIEQVKQLEEAKLHIDALEKARELTQTNMNQRESDKIDNMLALFKTKTH